MYNGKIILGKLRERNILLQYRCNDIVYKQ